MKMRLLLLPAVLYLVALPSFATEELDVTLTIIENETFSCFAVSRAVSKGLNVHKMPERMVAKVIAQI